MNQGQAMAASQVQEFPVERVPTPEPAGIILFGSALILFFIFLRRRLPSSQPS